MNLIIIYSVWFFHRKYEGIFYIWKMSKANLDLIFNFIKCIQLYNINILKNKFIFYDILIHF